MWLSSSRRWNIIFLGAGVLGRGEQAAHYTELPARWWGTCGSTCAEQGRTNQMDNVPWPQVGQNGQLGTLIVVTSYLLLSLKLKFVNVTKERSIVCSSNKTFLCWGPFPCSWHAGEVKSFEKSPSKVKTQTVSVIKSLPAWSNCFSWRPFFDSEYLRRFIHRLHTFPFILSTYFYLVLLFILSASYPRLRKVFTVLTCDDPKCF